MTELHKFLVDNQIAKKEVVTDEQEKKNDDTYLDVALGSTQNEFLISKYYRLIQKADSPIKEIEQIHLMKKCKMLNVLTYLLYGALGFMGVTGLALVVGIIAAIANS